MKKIWVVPMLIILLSVNVLADELEVIQKAGEQFTKKNYEEALLIIDDGIETYGETRRLLEWKLKILLEMKVYEEALDVALIKDDNSSEENPWDCLDIAKTYLYLEDHNKVMDWLNEAVTRGFVSYQDSIFDEFEVLSERDDYQRLIEKIRQNIGIGVNARDIDVDLITGERFQLAEQREKVVLIDFWSATSEPWLREIGVLKNLYAEFKDRGFEIISICLDKDQDDMERLVEKEGLGWNISFSGRGWDDVTAQLYGVNTIPSFWVVDKDGVLREFGLRGNELREAIEGLLGEDED